MAHQHKAVTSSTHGYTAPIPGARYEPRAHGAVTIRETCACGAFRRTNSNGRFDERGPWTMPTPVVCDFDSGSPLQGAPTDELVEQSAKAPSGAVLAVPRGDGRWDYVPSHREAEMRLLRADLRTVYVE